MQTGFPISTNMHFVSLSLSAVEVLDLALLHVRYAAEAMQDQGDGELHDFHQCRASDLFRQARTVAPDMAAQSQWAALRRL